MEIYVISKSYKGNIEDVYFAHEDHDIAESMRRALIRVEMDGSKHCEWNELEAAYNQKLEHSTGCGAPYEYNIWPIEIDIDELLEFKPEELFIVLDTCNGYYLVHNPSAEVACMGDGVDIQFIYKRELVSCGQQGFVEAWQDFINGDPATYLAAYFPHLL